LRTAGDYFAGGIRHGRTGVTGLDYDPIQLNRIIVQDLCLSMILPENRYPLFGIML
jgi:hypothetical protein